MGKLEKKQKGFTIIEVVLVLAIAGLIFMVVFLALPGLQRSQRDTQRKQDVGRFVSQLTTFQSNNKGSLPEFSNADDCINSGGTFESGSGGTTGAAGDTSVSTDYCLFIEKYLQADNHNFDDPQTHQPYFLFEATSTNLASINLTTESLGALVYMINGSCGPDGEITEGNNASFAVAVKIENGDAYCQEG